MAKTMEFNTGNSSYQTKLTFAVMEDSAVELISDESYNQGGSRPKWHKIHDSNCVAVFEGNGGEESIIISFTPMSDRSASILVAYLRVDSPILYSYFHTSCMRGTGYEAYLAGNINKLVADTIAKATQ